MSRSKKTIVMAKYLARACPRCNGYLEIALGESGRNVVVRAINGRCVKCGYRLAWILISGKRAALRIIPQSFSSAAVKHSEFPK
jgi:hypothetical protein